MNADDLFTTLKTILQTPFFWFLLSALLLWAAWRRSSFWRRVSFASAVFWLLSATPFGARLWLQSTQVLTLTDEPFCQSLSHPTTLIVLPGGIDWWTDKSRVQLSSWSRERADAALKRWRSGDKLLVPRTSLSPDYDEARYIADYLLTQGIPAEAITLTTPTATTFENLSVAKSMFTTSMVVLVTSDWHMPRAQRSARRLQLNYCSLASATSVEPAWYPTLQAHWSTAAAIHEWLGLLWYQITKRN